MHGQSPRLSACLKAPSAAVTCHGSELSLPAHPSTAHPMCCTPGEGAGQISLSLTEDRAQGVRNSHTESVRHADTSAITTFSTGHRWQNLFYKNAASEIL